MYCDGFFSDFGAVFVRVFVTPVIRLIYFVSVQLGPRGELQCPSIILAAGQGGYRGPVSYDVLHSQGFTVPVAGSDMESGKKKGKRARGGGNQSCGLNAQGRPFGFGVG